MVCVFSWLLYVDSWYRGSCVLLEEGQTVKTSGKPDQNLEETREPSRTDLSAVLQSVGSIRTLLKVSGSFPVVSIQLSFIILFTLRSIFVLHVSYEWRHH